jgi:hypothetical protein
VAASSIGGGRHSQNELKKRIKTNEQDFFLQLWAYNSSTVETLALNVI